MAFVAVCLFFFAFSTIMGWYFFGEQNVRFLFRSRGVLAYRLIVCAFIVTGAMLKVDFVWSLADLFNGLIGAPETSSRSSRFTRSWARASTTSSKSSTATR